MSPSIRTSRRPSSLEPPALAPAPSGPTLPSLGGLWTLAALAIALGCPEAGAVLWVLYAPQSETRLRRLGWIFAALALLGAAIQAATSGVSGSERWIRPYY